MLKKIMKGTNITWLIILGVLFIVSLVSGFILLGNENRIDLIINLYTEGLGVLFTVGIINIVLRMKDEETAEQKYQERLRREASSLSNDVALNAIHLLRVNGWLSKEESLLKNTILKKANLKKAPLDECNLADSDLEEAILDGAELSYSNLTHCNLSQATLRNAVLVGTKLTNCHLFATNLSDSSLSYAELQDSDCEGTNFTRAILDNVNLSSSNLKNADFTDADLTDCNFEDAIFDNTILPDGTRCDSHADMSAYFERKHLEENLMVSRRVDAKEQ